MSDDQVVFRSRIGNQRLLLLLCLALSVGLCACGRESSPFADVISTQSPLDSADLPFDTVATDDARGAGDFLHRSKHATLLILDCQEDLSDVSNRLPPDVLEKLYALNYETHFALVVFHGWRGKIGYRLHIERIEWRRELANVYAHFNQPEPGQQDYALVSPYQVVKAPKPGDWGHEIIFNLIIEGAVVASRHWPKKVDLPGEVELPFDTLARTEWGSGTGREYEAKEPALVIIAQSEEAEHAKDWAGTDVQAQLLGLDYSHYVALAVFQGRQPSSGFGVQIDRITRLRKDVNVYVRLNEPEPLTETLAIVTYPYHLVEVEQAQIKGATRINLVVDGMIAFSRTIKAE